MIKNFVAVRHREPIWQWPWTRMKKEAVGGRSAMPHPGAEKRKLFSQVQEQLSKPRITSNGFIYPNNIGDRAQVGRDKYCFIPSIKIPPKETKGNNKSSSWAPSNSAGSGRHLWPVSNFHFTAPQPPAFFTSCFMIYFQRYQTFFLPTKILSSCQISKQNTLSVSFHKIQFHFKKKKTLRAVSPVRKGGCPCSVESNPPLHGFKNTEIHHLFVWSKYTRNVSFPTDNDDTHTHSKYLFFFRNRSDMHCTANNDETARSEFPTNVVTFCFVLFVLLMGEKDHTSVRCGPPVGTGNRSKSWCRGRQRRCRHSKRRNWKTKKKGKSKETLKNWIGCKVDNDTKTLWPEIFCPIHLLCVFSSKEKFVGRQTTDFFAYELQEREKDSI